ncbi:hypothetical protein UP10_11580 [Bradyrhizobium sp. LTSPM299]|nr:hypothetical protein UP10_11580 [Bradyrhizobium sp. LTSPM299]
MRDLCFHIADGKYLLTVLMVQCGPVLQRYQFVSGENPRISSFMCGQTTGASTVSRHHTLPPIVYTPPPPEPKKTRRRRGVGTASGARETDETEEAGDVGDGAPVRSAPVLPRHSRPIEATERRTGSPNGKLSADTLRAMLDLQEEQTK